MFHVGIENGSLAQSVRQTQSVCQEPFMKLPEGQEKSPDAGDSKFQE